jgi:hypothetical protein
VEKREEKRKNKLSPGATAVNLGIHDALFGWGAEIF